MTRPRRQVVAIAAASVLGVSIGCTSGKQPPVAVRNALADSADQVLYHTKSVLTDGGVMKAEVYGDTAYVFDDNTRVEMRGVRTVFFTVTGAKNAVLTSLQGTYNTRTNNMEARGNVVVVSVDGRHLTTPVLRYSQARNEISSDSSWRLTDTTARQMTGIGFTSDPDMNNMRCFKACSGYAGAVTLPGGPGDTARSGAPVRAPSGGARPAPSSGAPPSAGGGAATTPGASARAAAHGRATGVAPRGMPGATTNPAAPAPAAPQPQASPPASRPTP